MSGLSREQLDICYKANIETVAALEGLGLAVRECQHQVRHKGCTFSIYQPTYSRNQIYAQANKPTKMQSSL